MSQAGDAVSGKPVKPSLRLDWCSYEAAKYAVMRWHYSRSMPASKLAKIGVWEDDLFVGAIIYGMGANRYLARPFGLKDHEACELVRVALASGRYWPTSKCLAMSLKMLKRRSPGLKVVVSYADTAQGHKGIIYQASNFVFLGETFQTYFRIHGKTVHQRSVKHYGKGRGNLTWIRANVDPKAEMVRMPAKLKYAYWLER